MGEFGGLAGDSLYVAICLGAVSIADLAQIALVTHSLGLAEYGRLALAMSVVVLVGRFFDVRVGTAETTFGASRMAAGDWDGLAGVFRVGYLIDAVTGILGFAIVAALAPFVGPWLVGDGGATLILLFALTLLISTVDDSSTTVLRLSGRFRLLAMTVVTVESLRIAAIALALAVNQSLTAVLVGLLAYDLVGAGVNLVAASRTFRRTAGRTLLGRASAQFAGRTAMLRMVIHTNVVSYVRIAQVQLPTLLLGALTSASEVGLYKVGAAAGSMVGRIADPLYMSVLPRLSRLWSAGKRDEIARLIRNGTPVAATAVGMVLLVVIVFSSPILRIIGGSQATAATPVLVLIGTGNAVSAVLFWNASLLFAAGRARLVAWISVATAVLQVGLLIILAPAFGATGAAVATCISLILFNLLSAYIGAGVLRRTRSEARGEDRLSERPVEDFSQR